MSDQSDDTPTGESTPGSPRPDPRPRPPSPDELDEAVAPADAAAAVLRRATAAAASLRRVARRPRVRRSGAPDAPSDPPGPVASDAPGASRDETVVDDVEVREPERVLVGAGGPPPTRISPSVFDAPPAAPLFVDVGAPEEWVRISRRSSPLKRALIVLVVLGLVVGVSGYSVLHWINGQIHPSGHHGDPVEFTIEARQTTNVIASNLAAKKVIGNATVFRYWLRRQGGEHTFKAGKYDLFQRMDYPELLAALRNGPKPPVFIKVTIPPGLTIAQMSRKLLDQLPSFNDQELAQALSYSQLDASYAPPGERSREGLFFPDTYNVDEDASGNEFALLKRLREQMDKVLKEVNAEQRASELGISVYDVLKVASLIEEEAKLDADRPKIARVIYNRLDKNMALGVDATTRYAVGKVSGEPLTQADLDSDSPYNTRKVKGLPPTPISAPGKKSIEAALNPTPDETWLYYVLTDEGGVKGAHRFVTTQKDFDAAKKVCVNLGYCS